MPEPHRRPTRLHPALALGVAGGLHAALFAGLRLMPPLPAAPRLDAGAEIELALDALDALDEQGAALPEPLPRAANAGRPAAPRAPALASPERPAAAGELARPGAGAQATPEQSGAPAAMKKPIDLGLNGWVGRAAAIEGWWEPPPPPPPPSVGRLVEGLAELDAQRGLSRSSAANRAGHQAALELAPDSGIGVFDVVTDGSGLVLSVTLVSAGPNEASWRRVGQRMLDLSRESRLRVPAGARGLAVRLRIERGELALPPSERGRTSRGTGVAQGPMHPRETSDESTRASLEPGRLSPTLGTQVAGGPRGPLTRVVLVSERVL